MSTNSFLKENVGKLFRHISSGSMHTIVNGVNPDDNPRMIVLYGSGGFPKRNEMRIMSWSEKEAESYLTGHCIIIGDLYDVLQAVNETLPR